MELIDQTDRQTEIIELSEFVCEMFVKLLWICFSDLKCVWLESPDPL